jgi:hypothetical protein
MTILDRLQKFNSVRHVIEKSAIVFLSKTLRQYGQEAEKEDDDFIDADSDSD